MHLLFESVELRAQLGRGQLQGRELSRADLGLGQALAQSTGGQAHLLERGEHLERFGAGRRLLAAGTGAQEKPRVCEQALAHRGAGLHKGAAQLGDLAAAQLGLDDRRGQAQTVLAAAARDRHQVAHRRMGGQLTAAHLLLDLGGQLADQPEVARDPAHALVQPPRKILLAQPLAAQRQQQPALLERAQRLRAALAAVEQQRLARFQIPHRGAHRVRAQTLETAQTLEAVDDHVAARLGHHHDRHLLAPRGQRPKQPALALRAKAPQRLVAAIELVKFQIHGAPPSLRPPPRSGGAATGIAWSKPGSRLFSPTPQTDP